MKLKNKLEVEETLEVGVIPNATTSNFSVVFETAGLFQRRQVGSIINKNDNEYLPSVSNAFPSSVFVVNASTTHANPNLTVSFVNQVAGTVFAAPQSLNGTPAFRMLQDSDLSQTSFNNKANIDGSNVPAGTFWHQFKAGGVGNYIYVDVQENDFTRVMVWKDGGWAWTNKDGFQSWLGIENVGLHKTKEIVGFSNYRRSVIPLVSLDNTDISFNSYFFGSVYAKRGNVIGHKINKIDISIGKMYNSDLAVGNVNFITNEDSPTSYFKPVIFIFSGIKFFGIEVGGVSSNYSYAYVDGITNNWSHINRVDFFDTQNSTVLNQEIYDSLEDYEFTNDSYNKKEEFLHKIKAEAFIKNGGDGSNILLDDGNVKAVSDFALASSVPTVNDGQLTLSTGTGLSGSANFTANQSGNSSFSVGIATTHKLPTVAEWNALPTTNTITRLRGTTSGTYTSGDLTLLAGANTTISQSGNSITISSTNTNTTYSAGTGLSLSGTTFGQAITTSGTGSFVTGITQTTNGFQVNLGTPPNTTYSAGTLALLNAGTNTSNRVWSAKILSDWLIGKGYLTSASLNNYYQSGDVNIPAKGGDYVVFPKQNGSIVGDFDNITEPGFYKDILASGSTNAPKAGVWWVENHNYTLSTDTRVTQYAHPYRVQDGKWMRNRFNGVWTSWVEFIHSGNLASYANTLLTGFVPTSRTLTINGTTFDLSQNRTWTIPDNDTITRLRGTTSGTFTSGDLTLLAGANTTITQSGANITIASTNTNTTYTAGTGLSLSGTTFGQAITTSGTGTYVQSITQTASGFQVNLGTPPNTNTTYSAGSGLTLSGTTFSLPITYSGTGNYVSAITQTTNGLTVTRATLPTFPTVNNGTFTVQGTGSLTGSGSTSANASANTNANLDLTQAEKDRIQQGVDANAVIPSLIDGVDYKQISTGGNYNISIQKKKTIINVSAGIIGAIVDIEDGLYDGYELAINGCGEWTVDLVGAVRNKCGEEGYITLGSNSTLFWWSAVDSEWIQAI